jgi:U6 snRNA phosphodiesterase
MTTEYELLRSLIAPFQDQGSLKSGAGRNVTSFITSELGAPLPLHISLSRPISFVAGQKDSFVASIQREIANCGVRP